YQELAPLVLGNLAWVASNLPIFLILAAILLPFAGNVPGTTGPEWVLVLIAWLLLFLPNPANLALASLAGVAAGPNVPRIQMFWTALRERWRLGLACFAISLLIAVALLANVYFYATLAEGWVRYLAIV